MTLVNTTILSAQGISDPRHYLTICFVLKKMYGFFMYVCMMCRYYEICKHMALIVYCSYVCISYLSDV